MYKRRVVRIEAIQMRTVHREVQVYTSVVSVGVTQADSDLYT